MACKVTIVVTRRTIFALSISILPSGALYANLADADAGGATDAVKRLGAVPRDVPGGALVAGWIPARIARSAPGAVQLEVGVGHRAYIEAFVVVVGHVVSVTALVEPPVGAGAACSTGVERGGDPASSEAAGLGRRESAKGTEKEEREEGHRPPSTQGSEWEWW